ncbi:MAG: hypothetical protein CM15mP84_05070 [Cellvibrionales bacterium]|nr:MAG: hypothetical protein CM15mP84_05070 [Cellvibrionales bacterium]
MEWLLDNYIGLLIAITLFMIYAKLDEVQTALKDNTQAVMNVEQEISFLSVEQQAFRDLRRILLRKQSLADLRSGPETHAMLMLRACGPTMI